MIIRLFTVSIKVGGSNQCQPVFKMLLQMVILVLSLSNVQSLSCVKGREDSFQYCEPSNEDKNLCRCNNIQINGTGYSDCKSIYDGTPWCYVTESSPCRDKKYSVQNGIVKATFGHAAPDIYFSDQACQQKIDFLFEELPTFLPGIELRGQGGTDSLGRT